MTRLLNGVSRRISAVTAVLASLCTIALAVTITIDVAMRLVTRASVVGLVEVSETLLVCIVFLGMAYTAYVGGHVAMSLVTGALPDRVAHAVRAIAYVLVLALIVWMIDATLDRAIASYVTGEYKFGLSRFPLWPARWVIVIGLAVAVPVALLKLIASARIALGRSVDPSVPVAGPKDPVDHAV